MMDNFTFTKSQTGNWELNYMQGVDTIFVPDFPEEITAHIEAINSFIQSSILMESPEVTAYKQKITELIVAKKGLITQADIDSINLI